MLFEHGFYMKIFKAGWSLFAWRYVAKHCGPGMITLSAFVDVNDVFDIQFCKLTFCTTRFKVNTIILMTFRHFRWDFRLESGKMQEYRSPMSVSLHLHLPGPPANVNVWKNMGDAFISFKGSLFSQCSLFCKLKIACLFTEIKILDFLHEL